MDFFISPSYLELFYLLDYYWLNDYQYGEF